MTNQLQTIDKLLLDRFPAFDCGCEVEYVVTLADGSLTGSYGWKTLYEFFSQTIESDPYYRKVFRKNGVLAPESLSYMLETNTKVAEFFADATQMSQEMHEVLVQIARHHGLLLTARQAPRPAVYAPAPRNPSYAYTGVVIEALEKIDPWLGYDTGTHSQHFHFFPWTNEGSYKLYTQVVAFISNDMENHPEDRFLDRWMSQERFNSWNKVVHTRSRPEFQRTVEVDGKDVFLWVTEPFDQPLISEERRRKLRKNHKPFIFDKFFWGEDPAHHDFLLHPKRSHFPISKKKPGKNGVYTIELRTADGPWADPALIEQTNLLYGTKILEALEKFPM